MTEKYRDGLKRAEECANAVIKVISDDHADRIKFSRETGCLVRDHILHVRSENKRMRELLDRADWVLDALKQRGSLVHDIKSFLAEPA